MEKIPEPNRPRPSVPPLAEIGPDKDPLVEMAKSKWIQDVAVDDHNEGESDNDSIISQLPKVIDGTEVVYMWLNPDHVDSLQIPAKFKRAVTAHGDPAFTRWIPESSFVGGHKDQMQANGQMPGCIYKGSDQLYVIVKWRLDKMYADAMAEKSAGLNQIARGNTKPLGEVDGETTRLDQEPGRFGYKIVGE